MEGRGEISKEGQRKIEITVKARERQIERDRDTERQRDSEPKRGRERQR